NLLSIDEGEIELLGKKQDDPTIFYDVSYLQDNRILYGNLTGYDHLKFICDVQKIPQTQIDLIGKQVGMDTYLRKKVKNYSLGMKQHLLLAMTIINEPKILLMDEPLNGLDPTSAINMRNILLELYQKGTTIFLSSHNLDEIDRLTDTIYFMKDGRLLKESLHDLSSTHYIVTVNDLSKAKQVLTESDLPFTVEADSTIVFKEADVSLQTFIDCLNAKDITITDLEKKKFGAENRYRQLFEGNRSV